MKSVIGVSVSAVLLAACGGRQPAAPPASSPVVVEAPGVEPRRVLRLHPAAHAVEHSELLIKTSNATDTTNTVLETDHKLVDFPSTKLGLSHEVLEVQPNGDYVVTTTIDRIEVLDDTSDPKLAALYKRELDKQRGAHTRWTISPAGEVVDAPHDTIGNAFASASVALPADAVGVGARWRARRHRTIGPIAWDIDTAFTLTALTDDTATIAFETHASAPSQALETNPNSSARLDTGSSRGTGEVTLHLDHVATNLRANSVVDAKSLLTMNKLRITRVDHQTTLLVSTPE